MSAVDPTLYTFTHPQHGTFTGTKKDFRTLYNIPASNFYKFLKGDLKSVSGWRHPGKTVRENIQSLDPTLYTFTHPQHGTFTGTKRDFRKKYLKESDTRSFFRVMAGTQLKVSGWQLGDAPPVVTTKKRKNAKPK